MVFVVFRAEFGPRVMSVTSIFTLSDTTQAIFEPQRSYSRTSGALLSLAERHTFLETQITAKKKIGPFKKLHHALIIVYCTFSSEKSSS